MDDSWTQISTYFREASHVMQQSIHQCAAIARIVARSRASMHHHSRRLVDHGEIVVFINNIERNLLSNSLKGRPLRLAQHADTFPAAQLQRSLRREVVHQHLASGNHLLHASAADGFKARGEKLIQSLAGVFKRNRNNDGKRFRHWWKHTRRESQTREQPILVLIYPESLCVFCVGDLAPK